MNPDELLRRIETLERQMREHSHAGLGDTRVNLRDILGAIEVVSAVPTGKPTSVAGQFKIYTNGSTYNLYWYDTKAGAWRNISSAGASVGSNKQIIFNDGGVLGASSLMTFDKGNGGMLSLAAPAAATGSGGPVEITSGAASTLETGGYIQLTAGDGGTGGSIFSNAGDATDSGSDGGYIDFSAGNGLGSGSGGDISFTAGSSPSGASGKMVFGRSNAIYAYRSYGKYLTTDNAYHSVSDINGTSSSSAGYIRARIIGKRTGGTAGTTNDMFSAEMVQGVKNNAGTVTLVGTLTFLFFYGDNAAVDAKFVVNGTTIETQVKGDTNNNYTFHYEIWFMNG